MDSNGSVLVGMIEDAVDLGVNIFMRSIKWRLKWSIDRFFKSRFVIPCVWPQRMLLENFIKKKDRKGARKSSL